MVSAAKANGLLAFDTVWTDTTDLDGLKKKASWHVNLDLQGKLPYTHRKLTLYTRLTNLILKKFTRQKGLWHRRSVHYLKVKEHLLSMVVW